MTNCVAWNFLISPGGFAEPGAFLADFPRVKERRRRSSCSFLDIGRFRIVKILSVGVGREGKNKLGFLRPKSQSLLLDSKDFYCKIYKKLLLLLQQRYSRAGKGSELSPLQYKMGALM